VITLRDLVGLSATEVCELLELTDANQRVLLHRAAMRRLFRRRRHRHDPLACHEFVELVTRRGTRPRAALLRAFRDLREPT
jgi:hypothetical protein